MQPTCLRTNWNGFDEAELKALRLQYPIPHFHPITAPVIHGC